MTGAELRAIRKRLRLSQTAFGALLGRQRDRIARYESGKAEIPQVVAVAARALEAAPETGEKKFTALHFSD